MTDKKILAFVGMPGCGKSEVVSYIEKKGIPFVRFGQITDDGIKDMGLPITSENEQMYREKIRKELGMGAYAIKSEQRINELLTTNDLITIDGLYSWGEYTLLKEKFPQLIVVHIYARPEVRYERLAKRQTRPFSNEEARKRDVAEIEKIDKGGPIAIADYLIENEDSVEKLHEKIDALLTHI